MAQNGVCHISPPGVARGEIIQVARYMPRDPANMIARARELVQQSREQRERSLNLRRRIHQTAERVMQTRGAARTTTTASRELLLFSKAR